MTEGSGQKTNALDRSMMIRATTRAVAGGDGAEECGDCLELYDF